ncbi:M48 family metallopeptidase [Nocardiopsis listeri]|uniref:M48 family metallopeptidase n=1 Tax=Nocardiopsis listeri TaxID=53440 RepID=UPI00082FC927|nr:SprT family zinc-dependent metalloprotease [Nocardiopsis listeri]
MPATLNTHPPERLHLEELVFSVRVSSRRKTAGITVDRDGSLILHVPEGIEWARVQEWVRRKRHWVRDKLADKDVLISRQPRREFVSGEGFDYLGRRYRLKVTDQVAGVHFNGGRIRMNPSVANGPDPAGALVAWYRDRAERWVLPRLTPWCERMGLRPEQVCVRDLGHRWGSAGRGGRLNLHWALMQLPPTIVDYVLVHELAHMEVPDHSPEFWDRVRTVMPDYERQRERLAVLGGQAWLG